jgi:predicted DNA-binding transcriptional regulator AlpA
MPEVLNLVGYKSPDTIYRLEREGKFPQRVELSERASRWREDEIAAWIEARSAERPAVA